MKKITNLIKSSCILLLFAASTQLSAQTCAANFSYNPGSSGLTNFTSTSTSNTATTTYYWNFGNGSTYSATGTSGIFAASAYSANGIYTVSLFILSSSPTCSAQSTQTILVANSTGCAPNANFTTNDNGFGVISFNNTSSSVGSSPVYNWDFGDGSANSSSMSPMHTYTANGTYIVAMSVSVNANCSATRTISLFVNSICNYTPSFSYTLGNNGVVNFQNTSTGTHSWYAYHWMFGDNTTGTGATATHSYTSGTYNVRLAVNNWSVFPSCGDTASVQIVVSTSCNANANFTLVPNSTPQNWSAIPSATNVTAATWSWGDGSSSNTLYTSHQYSAAGTYSICLTVTVGCGVSSSYCSAYNIYKGTDASGAIIYINVIDPSKVGINENQQDPSIFTVFPNPGNGEFNISVNASETEITNLNVYDLFGKIIHTKDLDSSKNNKEVELNLENIPNGVYFLELNSKNRSQTQKIILQK